jgi:hypothetical protein
MALGFPNKKKKKKKKRGPGFSKEALRGYLRKVTM